MKQVWRRKRRLTRNREGCAGVDPGRRNPSLAIFFGSYLWYMIWGRIIIERAKQTMTVPGEAAT